MTRAVLDASAILAFLHGEPGASVVEARLADGVASAVNVAEAGARLSDWGMGEAEIRAAITVLGIEIVPFDHTAAYASAALRPITRGAGLSIGDRACLALAGQLAAPAVTADRVWANLDTGIEIELIRE
ncbi:MAG: type II toxin-antitoxin system VapC family toxin [Alphaproteobacteria bacterium]|nr:type II toxin-antitoxin system VapC family toxin [Alphaproteobacteria bacterium]